MARGGTLYGGRRRSSVFLAALHTHSEEETLTFAGRFAALLEPGDFVALRGDLGAGKTLFVRGLVMAMGGAAEEVQSPTFTLVNRYETSPPLYHLDLYRLGEAEEELIALGLEEHFEPEGVIVAVEWAELAGSLLPGRRFEVALAPTAEGRRIDAVYLGETGQRHEAFGSFAREWLRAPERGDAP